MEYAIATMERPKAKAISTPKPVVLTFRKKFHIINKKGYLMFSIETISAKMLDYYVGRPDALIIDLRDRDSYRKSHITGALSYPYGELTGEEHFPRGKTLIFYCDRGGASMAAARLFVRKGYRTRSVIGGFEAYRGRNLVISR